MHTNRSKVLWKRRACRLIRGHFKSNGTIGVVRNFIAAPTKTTGTHGRTVTSPATVFDTVERISTTEIFFDEGNSHPQLYCRACRLIRTVLRFQKICGVVDVKIRVLQTGKVYVSQALPFKDRAKNPNPFQLSLLSSYGRRNRI